MSARHLVVMGVSGAGKTTLAEGIASALGWKFCEGDRLHPRANVEKMAAGVPLTDADRWPWLHALIDWIRAEEAMARNSVLACSALKRAYRDLLRSGAAQVAFVHVHGDRALLEERLESREGHFFPAALLDSQLQTLEPLGSDEAGVFVDLALPPDRQVAVALSALGLAHLAGP